MNHSEAAEGECASTVGDLPSYYIILSNAVPRFSEQEERTVRCTSKAFRVLVVEPLLLMSRESVE